MAGLAHLTLLTSGKLTDLVADDLEDELETAVTKRGVPHGAGQTACRPWLIATTIFPSGL